MLTKAKICSLYDIIPIITKERQTQLACSDHVNQRVCDSMATLMAYLSLAFQHADLGGQTVFEKTMDLYFVFNEIFGTKGFGMANILKHLGYGIGQLKLSLIKYLQTRGQSSKEL